MAQKTLSRPSAAATEGDVESQTRHLFHRVTCDDTKDQGSDLNARAYEEMQHDEPRALFGPDSLFLDSLVGHLHKHADNMRNDPALQRKVKQLQGDVSKETLWRVCKKLFDRVDDVWTGILALFAFGLELCRQMIVGIYSFIANTISAFIAQFAAGWLLGQGGWAAVMGAVSQGVNWLLGNKPTAVTQ
ncbi:uncharacterized protein [Littorina saxatilis]|uniref:Bcl-2 Bcl-2 homology region 1-3 domain-containing protein n=1 Tax=Littorina saxatilis TaxID=31220 RepID=A0AAN9B5U3_9CAEN